MESVDINLSILDSLKSVYHTFARRNAGFWCHICSFILTIVLSIAAYFYGGVGKVQEIRWCIIVAFFIPVTQFIGFILDKKTQSLLEEEKKNFIDKIIRLKKDNDELKNKIDGIPTIEKHYSVLFNSWAGHLLRLQKCTCKCRVTFYIYDDHGAAGDNEFVQVARDSEAPELRNKGRGRYPSNQGVIAKAWNSAKGEASYFATKKCTNDKIIEDFINLYEFTQLEAENLYFIPHTIFGTVLKDAKGKVGVIIFESEENLNKEQQQSYQKKFKQNVSSLSAPLIQIFEVYKDYALNQEEEEVEE